MKSRKLVVKDLRARTSWEESAKLALGAYSKNTDIRNRANSPPVTQLEILGRDNFFRAIASALGGEIWEDSFSKSASYRLLAARMNFYWHRRYRVLFPDSGYPLRLFNWVTMTEAMASCFILGWIDDGTYQGLLVHAALNCGYQVEQSYEQEHRRAHAFMLRLFADWNGTADHQWPQGLSNEPIYEAILSHWRDPDPETLAGWIVAACDRHFAESRYDTEVDFFDFGDESMMRTPLEILMVLRLRQLIGLVTPIPPHPLMEKPFDSLLPTQPMPDIDPIAEAALGRLRSDWPDYDQVVSLNEVQRVASGC